MSRGRQTTTMKNHSSSSQQGHARGVAVAPFDSPTKCWLWYFRGCNPSGGACWWLLLGLNHYFGSPKYIPPPSTTCALLPFRVGRTRTIELRKGRRNTGTRSHPPATTQEMCCKVRDGNSDIIFSQNNYPNCRPLASLYTWRNLLWLLFFFFSSASLGWGWVLWKV